MRVRSTRSLIPQTVSVPGYNHFLTPLRKVIIDYDPYSIHQDGVRSWLKRPFLKAAEENPDIEFLVRPLKRGKAAVLRGLYTNGRDKIICVNDLPQQEVATKVELLLNASGAKIKHLKNNQLEAAPGGESARGVWSVLHDHSKPQGGYFI